MGIAGEAGRREARSVGAPELFHAGAVVLVTLNSPREKFWGVVAEVVPAGVTVRGIELNSFDDFVGLIRSGESVSPGIVFFPMHRVERMELDARNGEIPSLRERFEEKTNRDLAEILSGMPEPNIHVGCTMADAERLLIEATLAAVQQDFARAARILGMEENDLRSRMNP